VVENACLASMKSWLQTTVPPPKKIKIDWDRSEVPSLPWGTGVGVKHCKSIIKYCQITVNVNEKPLW
jgi:hypothetical protein